MVLDDPARNEKLDDDLDILSRWTSLSFILRKEELRLSTGLGLTCDDGADDKDDDDDDDRNRELEVNLGGSLAFDSFE